MTNAPYGLHWFRRDLRVAGNPALQAHWKRHRGRVVGLFTFDARFLARPDFSINRFGFFLETLKALRDELRSLGSDLLVLDVGPREAFAQLTAALAAAGVARPSLVTFNRDYEPFARERDAALLDELPRLYGVPVETFRDHLLIEPDELFRGDAPGQFYQVYTPFSKRWFALARTAAMQERIAMQQAGLRYLDEARTGRKPLKLFQLTWAELFGSTPPPTDHLDHYATENARRVTVPLPPAGSQAALARLRQFLDSAVDRYEAQRDLPAIDGTSQLSIYLKNGSLTSAQVLAELAGAGLDLQLADGVTKFVKEIVWREFYYHILYHRPAVEQSAFLTRYADLAWENRTDWFEAWKQGMTGYPIVDAGMRQLRETGWMHNRVRMIVASFLTKDLLIDWRWGERYFMEQLLDGDLAPNNGGWQWAASTGCDPQPYFRIFNPKLQSEKFDPAGEYLRRYLPELAHVSRSQIHDPPTATRGRYPAPIVNHAEQKDRALQLYRGEA